MKKFLSLLLALTLVVSMLSAFVVSAAVNTTVFYNAITNEQITSLDNAESIYATTTFTGRYENNASVIVSHYDENGKLVKVESIVPVASTIGASVTYTTPAILVDGTDIVKLFAWTGVETIKPLLKFPGVISRSIDLPTATATKLDVEAIDEVDLTFAMNFKADPATKAQLLAYGNWYADFVLTVNKDVTYNANGTKDGYLAGQYDSWSPAWVVVPNKDVTVKAGESVKIMETAAQTYGKAGLKYTYQEVYDRVKDFDCGVFFSDEFLAANPDICATLELRIYNPLNENESYLIGETYTFTNTFTSTLPTATVTELDVTKIDDVDLTFALNFKADEVSEAVLNTYGNWRADYELIINKDVTFNADGSADAYLSGQYNAWSENWISVPGETITLDANTPVKVMETAAALMGYKTTPSYADIYEFVKEFNCGIYFAPEFLAANPGLEVKLALKIYNPANEDEFYIIGEEYLYKPQNQQNIVEEAFTLTYPNVTVSVANGVVLENGARTKDVSFICNPVEDYEADVVVGETEDLFASDMHVSCISSENTVPIIIELKEYTEPGYNKGNLSLFHVENGETVAMEEVESKEDLVKHNQFTYNPEDGTVTLAMATFSEVALVAETEKGWEGEYDYTWYNKDATAYTIANADQLAAFGRIVGGMAEDIAQDSFAGKTVKLISDINLNDAEDNNTAKIFHPIGYYYTPDKEGDGTNVAYSTVYAFEGTFDGNGHTVANFYQNTWEIKGDYNDGYPAGSNYYKDGFGLFGYVYNGTVKNLIVRNFSSDGEFTPTGIIATYAGGESTFENINVFDCTPRVYQTADGGIVGLNSSKTEKCKLTFRNITVDQSNTISALWGNWGLAGGNIMGWLRGNPENEIIMENCHAAAVMDVNNDICGNYHWYLYRYAGMYIGTIENLVTDTDGRLIPDLSGITAINCTATFGSWNEYWYCELVENTIASYTHDHQFSRLDRINDVSEIKDENGNWNKVGNFVIVTDATTNSAECFHIRQDAEGNFYEHKHDVADELNPNIYEDFDLNGDGLLNDLKEDRQRYYVPFNQLFNGYGEGIKPIYNVNPIAGEENPYSKIDITIEESDDMISREKFQAKEIDTIVENATLSIGELFAASGQGTIAGATVQVYVSPADENSTVSAVYTAAPSDWRNGFLSFTGTGLATITITDYFYCVPTTITVTVEDRQPVEKFETKFTGDFLYRVGNQGTVAYTSLFAVKDGATITGDVAVSVDPVEGSQADGTYDKQTGMIQFTGTGLVKVTINDADELCKPTELLLEVVDATNVTVATHATSGNIVLLNDAGLSSLTVSGDYTFYGNGFTLTYTGDGRYLNNGLKLGIVNVSGNGTLDNVRIVASIYPVAYMYYNNASLGSAVTSGPKEVDGDKTRYYYQLSAVSAKENATISNCYIYGGRNNIYINTGDVTIEDTILECGTVANIQIQSNSSHTITMNNVTTIQHQVHATIGDTSNIMLGAGVLVGPDTSDNPIIVLNGDFKQYNWVNADDKSAVSDEVAQTIIQSALDASEFNHSINGKTASNLGIIYMNDYSAPIEDSTGSSYKLGTVSLSGVQGRVYSLQNAPADQIYSDYATADKATVNDLYKPQFKFLDNLGGQKIPDDGGDEFFYQDTTALNKTVKVMFPSGETREYDLAAMVDITKYSGQDLGVVITCKDAEGNNVSVTDGKVNLSAAGTYTVTYTVTDTVFYDKDGVQVADSKEYSWNVTLDVSLKDTSIPDAYYEFDASKQKMGYYKPSIGDVKQYLPFLAGLKIYDYNAPGGEAYLRFNGDSDYNKIASITITGYTSNEAYIEVTLTDGGVIKTKFLARADSGGGSTYTGKIKTSSNTVYFVTDSGTSNKDSTTTAAYWYVDYYKFIGNNGVEITSAQQTFNSTGSSASTPSGSFGTTIKYTVTYEANGGDCGQATGYATSASAAVTLPTPRRGGYIFAGWYTAASGGTRVGGAGESYTPSANITLYAQWGKPCDVFYNANGGTCTVASEKYTGTALTLPTATRDGYWFVGWYDAAEGGNKIGDAGATYNPASEITLYAHWQEKVEYTVTYNANGGTCGTASATYQGTALTLPTPTKTGHTFNGWYDAASGGNKIGDAGASYIPSANITLYAQWTIGSYTVKVSATNATVKINNTTVANNGSINIPYGTQVTVDVTYSQSNSRSTTIKGADGATYTSPFNMPAQTVTVTASSSSSCFTEDTLITMGDGSQKAVKDITKDDTILTYNFFTGEYEAKDVALLISHGVDTYAVTNLTFSDGTTLRIVGDHGVFDYDLNDYVYITVDNMDAYIGHTFVKENAEGYDLVTLVKAEQTEETLGIYSLTSAGNANAFAEGMLTMAPPGDFYNWIEMGDKLRYDVEQFQSDVETYGLYTFEDFGGLVTEEQFTELNGAYLKIAVEKGIFTWDYIVELIGLYVNP